MSSIENKQEQLVKRNQAKAEQFSQHLAIIFQTHDMVKANVYQLWVSFVPSRKFRVTHEETSLGFDPVLAVASATSLHIYSSFSIFL